MEGSIEHLIKGDVISVPFPFSDTSTTKKRPALAGETHLNFIDKIPFLCINERIGIYRLMDFFRVIVMV
jgi:hypothetical protein